MFGDWFSSICDWSKPKRLKDNNTDVEINDTFFKKGIFHVCGWFPTDWFEQNVVEESKEREEESLYSFDKEGVLSQNHGIDERMYWWLRSVDFTDAQLKNISAYSENIQRRYGTYINVYKLVYSRSVLPGKVIVVEDEKYFEKDQEEPPLMLDYHMPEKVELPGNATQVNSSGGETE